MRKAHLYDLGFRLHKKSEKNKYFIEYKNFLWYIYEEMLIPNVTCFKTVMDYMSNLFM